MFEKEIHNDWCSIKARWTNTPFLRIIRIEHGARPVMPNDCIVDMSNQALSVPAPEHINNGIFLRVQESRCIRRAQAVPLCPRIDKVWNGR
jgi:hypothetical protein